MHSYMHLPLVNDVSAESDVPYTPHGTVKFPDETWFIKTQDYFATFLEFDFIPLKHDKTAWNFTWTRNEFVGMMDASGNVTDVRNPLYEIEDGVDLKTIYDRHKEFYTFKSYGDWQSDVARLRKYPVVPTPIAYFVPRPINFINILDATDGWFKVTLKKWQIGLSIEIGFHSATITSDVTLVESCDVASAWNYSSQATVPTNDTVEYKEGSGAINMGKNGTSLSTFSYNQTITTTDFYPYQLFVWIYVDGDATLGNLSVAYIYLYTTDSSNWIRTKLYPDGGRIGRQLYSGWNRIAYEPYVSTSWNDGQSGSPNTNTIDILKVSFETNNANDTIRHGALKMDYWCRASYVTVSGGTEESPLDILAELYSASETNGWGFIFELGYGRDTQPLAYKVLIASIRVGNGSETWGLQTRTSVLWQPNWVWAGSGALFQVQNNAHMTLGTLLSATEKSSYDGCSFEVCNNYYGAVILQLASSSYGDAYSSSVYTSGWTTYATYGGFITYSTVHTMRLYNILLTGHYNFATGVGVNLDAYNVVIAKSGVGLFYGFGGTVNDLKIYNCTDGFYMYGAYSMTVQNAYVRGCTYSFKAYVVSASNYFIDCDIDDWNIRWTGTSTASQVVVRQYSFDVTVTYLNGTAINGTSTGCRVTIQHYGQSQATDYNATLNEDGTINQTVLSKEFFNQTGGNTPYSFEPFNLQISNIPGYADYEANFTLDSPTDWTIALTPSTEPTYDCDYIGLDNTLAGQPTEFSSQWSSLNASKGLSRFRFSTNNTGTWRNDSWSDAWDGVWARTTKNLNWTAGITVGFRFYVNDTNGEVWASKICLLKTFQTGGAMPPVREVVDDDILKAELTHTYAEASLSNVIRNKLHIAYTIVLRNKTPKQLNVTFDVYATDTFLNGTRVYSKRMWHLARANDVTRISDGFSICIADSVFKALGGLRKTYMLRIILNYEGSMGRRYTEELYAPVKVDTPKTVVPIIVVGVLVVFVFVIYVYRKRITGAKK